jgi:hypothetical protein
MSKIVTLAALLSTALLMSGCAAIGFNHVVGITEGAAHRKADAQCRTQGQVARVHEWLRNSLAFECVDRESGAAGPAMGLTNGPL